MKSSQVLLLEEKIKSLERQLYLLAGLEKLPSYLVEEAIEIDCPIVQNIQIPLYFRSRINLDKYKFEFKAFISGQGEFAYYCDTSHFSVYEEAKIFDEIIEKLVYQFANSLIQKRKQNESL